MKRFLSFVLTLMMILCLAACGGKTDPAPSGNSTTDPGTQQTDPGTSGQSEKMSDEDYLASVLDYVKSRHSEAAFIFYDDSIMNVVLQVWACEPNPDNSDYCILSSYWGYNGRQSAYERDKEAELIGDNVERNSVEVTWNDDLLCYSYENPTTSWATAESLAADYTVAQERGEIATQPQDTTDNGTNQPEKTPDTITPAPSDDDDYTVAEFLAYYGMTEDDVKPEHFTEFSAVTMDDDSKAGERSSMGYIKIFVDKDATTQEDINAWFEKLYAKMLTLSTDGKLHSNFAAVGTEYDEEASLQSLMESPLWAKMPGGSCVYLYNLSVGEAKIVVASRYDMEAGEYRLSFAVKG